MIQEHVNPSLTDEPCLERQPAHRPNSRDGRLVVRCAQILIAAWFLLYVVQALNSGLWFKGAPADGPFELFNPLRRIAAGQVPGRDFIQYHGIGGPYLQYPLFALFGGKTLIQS